MCGRLNVIDAPLCRVVCERLSINFTTSMNTDLRPTQKVATVGVSHCELKQLDLSWGIKPGWAKRIIINAQAETVMVKHTFSQAFEQSRVIVPCTGWYEWREEQGKKVKYLFSQEEGKVLYMAGIALNQDSKLVTLTTKANQQCSDYHHRMPLFISEDALLSWVTGLPEGAFPLLNNQYLDNLNVKAC